MESIAIEGIVREDLGKKATKALRRDQQIPCVLYGGEDNVHFSVTAKSLKGLVYTPDFHIATLDLSGKKHNAIIKDIQFDPITEGIVHVDFQELIPGRVVQTEIPVKTKGIPAGVKTGGKLMMKVRKLKVKSTPEELIDKVEIDVTKLNLGQSFKVRDITGIGMQIMNSPSIPIASVEIPRALRSAKSIEEEEAEEAEEAAAAAAAAEGGEAEGGSEE